MVTPTKIRLRPAKGIQPERITDFNRQPIRKGAYVLYWMQQSQRAHDNHALEMAIRYANHLELPVVVAFALTDRYPEANVRHFRFMLEGLRQTRAQLVKRRIGMTIEKGDPPAVIAALAPEAALIICDVGYTRHQRRWRDDLATDAQCRVMAVESDVVVPVTLVSPKAEYAARTIRPKINRHLDHFLIDCPRFSPKHGSVGLMPEGLAIEDIDAVLANLSVDRSIHTVSRFFRGGPKEAKKRLRRFIRQRLHQYDAHRNQPQTDDISHMSPYLHFGQISPVFVALEISRATTGQGIDRAAYLEELVVRRELAVNYAFYCRHYDRFEGLPQWARTSLDAHANDPRPHQYSKRTLEHATTHDPYWNAAMVEMRATGFMHNYMRMYWGKKILQWAPSPQKAYEWALQLNNKYFLDGRDPNSFAGVGWVFGLHDRAWFERPIFGKVRYMAASGLRRKCDIDAYVAKVNRLHAQADESLSR